MKLTVMKPVEIEVSEIYVELPVRYEEEDIPNDFPLRSGDFWKGTIDLATGKIREWPVGTTGKMHMKCCDEGSYYLRNSAGEVIAELDQEYVPGCLPGSCGDYVEFDIDANGVIANWARECTVANVQSAFFGEDE